METQEVSAKRQKQQGKTKTTTKKKKKTKEKKKSLETILSENEEYLELINTTYGDKVRCKLNGHDMKPDPTTIEKFLGSKSFIRAKEEWFQDSWVEDFPFLKPSKKNSKKLYCTLTKRLINKIKSEAEAHCSGRKFQRKKKEREEKEAKAKEKEESDLLEDDGSEMDDDESGSESEVMEEEE